MINRLHLSRLNRQTFLCLPLGAVIKQVVWKMQQAGLGTDIKKSVNREMKDADFPWDKLFRTFVKTSSLIEQSACPLSI